jgi:hypothetical protein
VSSSNFSNSYLNALSIVITPCMITPPTRGSNRCIPHSCVLHGMRRHHYIGHTLLCLTHRSPFLSCRLLLVDSLLYLWYTHTVCLYKLMPGPPFAQGCAVGWPLIVPTLRMPFWFCFVSFFYL